jgi:hypothetical protein
MGRGGCLWAVIASGAPRLGFILPGFYVTQSVIEQGQQTAMANDKVRLSRPKQLPTL